MIRKFLSMCIIVIFMLYAVSVVSSKAASAIKVGDYVVMGKYYGTPILWRCVNIDSNGPLMLSDKIITIKQFDVNGVHTYSDGTMQIDENDLRLKYGSNLWETSNIRSWLNSSKTKVTWADGCPPTSDKCGWFSNDYANEPGFLSNSNFTDNERKYIKSVTQKSLLNALDAEKLKEGGNEPFNQDSTILGIISNYDNSYYHMISDKVFLLDVKQISMVYGNSKILGKTYYIGQPTKEAALSGMGSVNSINGSPPAEPGKSLNSWLRTPDSNFPNKVRTVEADGSIGCINANDNPIGIRPAFYLNISSVSFKSGTKGSYGNPYILSNGSTKKTVPKKH